MLDVFELYINGVDVPVTDTFSTGTKFEIVMLLAVLE
jgi:hypothetical protein